MEEVFQDNQNASLTQSPKRDREAEDSYSATTGTWQSKRLRKVKVTTPPLEKDRTRGRYACLGHRMKHKRCPLDCPERRPKPQQEQMEGLTGVPVKEPVVIPVIKTRPRASSAKKNVLKLEDCTIMQRSHPIIAHHPQGEGAQVLVPLQREPNWDSVAWEALAWDSEPVENVAWDLKSSSHWEESKSREVTPEADGKPTDDLTKFEEDDIIDSWLNDDVLRMQDGQEDDVAERNASETDLEARDAQYLTSATFQLVNILPKILITRDMLERWLNEPYFNHLVKGCFVRVKLGDYMGAPVHRIAHIDEVFDTCYFPYNLTRVQTTKGLSLHVGGSSKKTFPLLAISNQPPSEDDLRHWQEEMEKSNIILDPLEVQQKEEIVRVLNINYPEFDTQAAEPLVKEPTIWTSC